MAFARSLTTTLCVASAPSFGVLADSSTHPCCRAPTLECLKCAFCERNPKMRICGQTTTSTVGPTYTTSTVGPTYTTSTAGPSARCTAKITSNADCNSADITNVTGSSTHECCAACTATEGCGAFVWVQGGQYDHTCFLKTHCELKPGSCAGSTCTAGMVTNPPVVGDYPDGGRSEEKLPDSMLWELFNASGSVLEMQAEHEAEAMGLNGGDFEEFVPVRYAEQLVAGLDLFVRVRVSSSQQLVFIDTLIHQGLSTSNAEPELQAIRFVKDEEDPISDFNARPTFQPSTSEQPVEVVV